MNQVAEALQSIRKPDAERIEYDVLTNSRKFRDRARIGILTDSKQISMIVNSAFLVESFFKKPECINRLDPDGIDAQAMMIKKSGNASFLVIERTFDDKTKRLIAAVWVHWHINGSELCSEVCQGPTGNVSMVSVLPEYSSQGVGKVLLKAAEELCSQKLNEAMPSNDSFTMEIPVVHERLAVLLPWYEKQGYERKENIPFVDSEVVLEGHHVELVILRKKIMYNLQTSQENL